MKEKIKTEDVYLNSEKKQEKEKEPVKITEKVKEEKPKKLHYKFKTKGKAKMNIKWPFVIAGITFGVSFAMNIIASIFTSKLSLAGAWVVLFAIVFLGILFDILGTAVVSADVVSFSSMAANRVRGAKESIAIIKRASIFSNIFNDVIGDTCGIISGATAGAIFIKVAISTESIFYTIVSAFIAALTVGGKAFGKGLAIKYSASIVYTIGRIASIFNLSNYKLFRSHK